MARIKRTIEPYLLVTVYRICIDLIYNNIISTEYLYAGFRNDFSFWQCCISIIVLLAFMRLMIADYYNKNEELSKVILLLLFLLSFVPFTSMWAFGMLTYDFIIANLIFWFLLILSTNIKKFQSYRQFRITNYLTLGEMHVKIATVLFAVVVLYISGRYTHFRFNFSLLNVYTLRGEAKNYSLSQLLRYVFSWTRTVICVLIAYFLRKKRYIWAIVCVFVQFLNFGIDGSKTTIALTVLSVLISLLPAFEMVKLNRWVFIGLVGVCTVGLAVYYIFGNIMIVSLFVRRMLCLPVDISTKYFDFFTTHTPDYYRQSFLRFLGVLSPYKSLPYMISEVYYNTKGMSSNNGLISDAISNMGYLGVFVAPFIYAFVFKLLDRVSKGLDKRVHLAIALYASVTLINAFLFTTLLTHGILITMFLLRFMDREDNMIANNITGETDFITLDNQY